MPQTTPSAPRLAEVKPLTFGDHVTNIFRLVIKELRSIRADPVIRSPLGLLFGWSSNTNLALSFTYERSDHWQLTLVNVPEIRRGSVESGIDLPRSFRPT